MINNKLQSQILWLNINSSNCLAMRCYKYTNVCPGGRDKLETNAPFSGTHRCCLSPLIPCHCSIPLLGPRLAAIRDSRLTGGWDRIIRICYYYNKGKSSLQLIPFDLIIRDSGALGLREVSIGFRWQTTPRGVLASPRAVHLHGQLKQSSPSPAH